MQIITSKRKTWFLFIFVLLCSSFTQILYAYSPDKPIVIGIFPRRNSVKTISYFKPMQVYLEKELKQKVILKASKNFSSFWQDVQNRRYDIVHFNQYHYMVSQKKFGYEVILKNREFGESTITGSIIVRKDSGINHVNDLRGKIIVFGGGPRAMQSYIYARYLLEKNGLKPNDYYSRFAKNPPNAIIATFLKQANAAGSGEKVLRLGVVKNLVDTSKLKYMLKGEQLAHLPWAVDKSVPATLKMTIQTLLSDLKNTSAGMKILKSAKLDALDIATDKEYDPHRSIVKAVLAETY